jgi:hypothetical protein
MSLDLSRAVMRCTAGLGALPGDVTMIFTLKKPASTLVRPRVTPDPTHAAELQRRIEALNYSPSNGFHRDRQQDKAGRAQVRLTLVRN